MSLNQNTVIYAGIMLLAGLGIPVMAALNGGLGSKLQSPLLATTILFTLAGITSICVLLFLEGLPQTIFSPFISTHYYLGGFFVAFYVLSITWVAPKFGISNAITFVLLGQLISMSVIDHFALLGAHQFQISWQRLAGLLLMASGVLLVLRR